MSWLAHVARMLALAYHLQQQLEDVRLHDAFSGQGGCCAGEQVLPGASRLGRLAAAPSAAVLWKRLEAFAFLRAEPLRMSDEILTVQEVATLLKVADKTVYTMAQKGEIPAFKVRGQWRFRRVDIDAWIQAQTTSPRRQEDGDA